MATENVGAGGWGLGLLTPNAALSSLYLHNAESKVKTIEVWPS